MPRTSFAMSRYVFFLDALDRRILHEGLESAHVEGELVTLRNEKIDLGDLLLEGNQDRATPGDEGEQEPVLLAELLRHLALHDLGLAPERLGKERAGDPRPDQDEGHAEREPDEEHQGLTPELHRLSPRAASRGAGTLAETSRGSATQASRSRGRPGRGRRTATLEADTPRSPRPAWPGPATAGAQGDPRVAAHPIPAGPASRATGSGARAPAHHSR